MLRGNHPKTYALPIKKLASSSLASFLIIIGKHLLQLFLTCIITQLIQDVFQPC